MSEGSIREEFNSKKSLILDSLDWIGKKCTDNRFTKMRLEAFRNKEIRPIIDNQRCIIVISKDSIRLEPIRHDLIIMLFHLLSAQNCDVNNIKIVHNLYAT